MPRFAAARGQQNARRGHVQAVAQAALARIGRSGRALGKTGDQRACQRGAVARVQRMRGDTRGFVNGHQVAVLVEHGELLIEAWFEHGASRAFLDQLDDVAGLQVRAFLGGTAAHAHDARGDCTSRGGSAGKGLPLGQKTVEPRAGLTGFHHQSGATAGIVDGIHCPYRLLTACRFPASCQALAGPCRSCRCLSRWSWPPRFSRCS
jgi:hypothetical protein